FQAEDGIRDYKVTGVQTCALPICIVLESDFTYEGSLDPLQCPIGARCLYEHMAGLKRRYSRVVYDMPEQKIRLQFGDVEQQTTRSEERRVGKEGRERRGGWEGNIR